MSRHASFVLSRVRCHGHAFRRRSGPSSWFFAWRPRLGPPHSRSARWRTPSLRTPHFRVTNQKIVQNAYGIFMAYSYSQSPSPLGTWRLARSIDGGKSWGRLPFVCPHHAGHPRYRRQRRAQSSRTFAPRQRAGCRGSQSPRRPADCAGRHVGLLVVPAPALPARDQAHLRRRRPALAARRVRPSTGQHAGARRRHESGFR